MVIELALQHGQTALVDDEDYEKVSVYKWSAIWHRNTKRYQVRGYVNGRMTGIHRVIMDAPANLHVDHINGDPMDNRRCNLRLCNNQQNHQNMRKHRDGSSRYKGVSWLQSQRKWVAQIYVEGHNIVLGTFVDEKQAAQTYDEAAAKHFGEFAWLNSVHIKD